LNALEVVKVPAFCRRVVCSIDGTREVRTAVERAGVNILAARARAGVLAFGADADVRKAFQEFEISEFDVHSIETPRLRYDSAERGLLRDALSRAMSNTLALRHIRRRNGDMLAPSDVRSSVWQPLSNLVGALSGEVKGQPGLSWHEGVGTRLDWGDDRLWLLIEPRIVFSGHTAENKLAASDFARERTVKRYNRQLNELIAFWANVLCNRGSELRAFDTGEGLDGVFALASQTAYTRRVRP
jgi:hypothetical protein